MTSSHCLTFQQVEEPAGSTKKGAVNRQLCLLRAETKEMQSFWASQIQMAILKSRPVTPKGYEAYGAFFKVESAIERVTESLAIRNKKYKVHDEIFLFESFSPACVLAGRWQTFL